MPGCQDGVLLALLVVFEDVLVAHVADTHGTDSPGVDDGDDAVYHGEVVQGDVQVLADEKIHPALPPVVAHLLGPDIVVGDADGVQGIPETPSNSSSKYSLIPMTKCISSGTISTSEVPVTSM